MPLIILTGYPCSGLSYRARQLATLLESVQDSSLLSHHKSLSHSSQKPRYKLVIVSSHDSTYPRTIYDNAREEKEARGLVFARVKRALGRDTIVILDGMNHIKGWRYQLWCESKATGTTCCVVHIGTPVDQCIANNNARWCGREQQKGEGSNVAGVHLQQSIQEAREIGDAMMSPAAKDGGDHYPPELLNNLIFRYEEPSTHSRWDKPLFTVLWSDASPPAGDIWTAITGISVSEPTRAVGLVSAALAPPTASEVISESKPAPSDAGGAVTSIQTIRTVLPRPKIKPHQATIRPAATDPGALSTFEKKTSSVIFALRNFTLSHPSAEAALAQGNDPNGITIPIPEATIPVFIPAHVAISGMTDELSAAGGILAFPRLQRLRRQWIGLNRAYIGQNQGQGKGGLSSDQVGDAFIRYINAEFTGQKEDE